MFGLKCGGLLFDRHKTPLTRRFVVYYCSAVYSSEHITVHVLVETGFARDLVEANLIFDIVEWAMGEAGL